MRGITRDCVVQFRDRKAIWLYVIVTIVMVAVIIITGQVRISGGMEGGLEIKAEGLDEVLGLFLMKMFGAFVSFMVILTVLLTAGDFPVMLVPGRAEFYLSKPISRTWLYINKMIGILVTYGALIVICGLIGYATMRVVFSYSADGIAYVFILNLVSLFIWLTITSFAGIVFGTTTMAFVIAGMVWALQLVLQWRDFFKQLVDSKILEVLVDILYFIVPNTGDLSDLTLDLATGERIASWAPLYTSVGFALVLVVVTLVIFNRKNY